MSEDDTDDIRKKNAQEQKRYMEAAKAEEQLKAALRVALEDPAYNRMMNISYANKEFYVALAQHLLMVFKQVRRKVSEEEVLFVIRSIKNKTEHEPEIRFHKK